MTTARIDHFLLGCRDLETGIDRIESLTGVRAAIGGRHPGRGTQNALLSLGERCYLEIIAPDPTQDGGPWSDRLPDTDEPTLFHWAIAVTDLADLAAQLPSGLTHKEKPAVGSRTAPDLGQISWSMLMLDGGVHGALIPFLLDWRASRHPAETAPPCGAVASVQVQSPEANALRSIFSTLGVSQQVNEAPEPAFDLTLDTPNGIVRFAMPTPIGKGLFLGNS